MTLDLTGQRFGLLTVLGPASLPLPAVGGWWRCRCTCGREVVTPAEGLRNRRVQRCQEGDHE